jgi:hypothetical protein
LGQGLIVEFFKGHIETKAGDKIPVYIAITPFGRSIFAEGSTEVSSQLDLESIVITESLSELDLEDLNRESGDVIVRNILERGYLEKIGNGVGGDALLFTLVNEAIQLLEETAADFSLTE